MTGRCYLEFCGEDLTLEPGTSLTFGRSAELHIDDNPYLHRVLARITDRGGVWCLDHLGRSTPITVADLNGPSRATVHAGASAALSHGEFVISFAAGPTRYELLGALESHEHDVDLLGPDGRSGTATLDFTRVELNPDQRLLLIVMCEAQLRQPGARPPVPTNRSGARRLGWTLPKFNRKLDHLCEKLHRSGVSGLHGALGASAADRRRVLIDHAISAGLVTHCDLADLDGLEGRAGDEAAA